MSSNYQGYVTAGDIIRQGWIRRDYENDKGSCLVDALSQAFGEPLELTPEIIQEVHEQLQLTYPSCYQARKRTITARDLEDWNDHPRRKVHQVLRVLDNLAARLEAEWLRGEVARLQAELARANTRIGRLTSALNRLLMGEQERTIAAMEAELTDLSLQLEQVAA